jgi:predicted extracellular nuclease
MSEFSIASFNVKNLIGPGQEYYEFESYTAEEYAWKRDWLSDQLLAIDADIVGFQEIFEEDALAKVVADTNAKGAEANAASIPEPGKRYARKAIFRKLKHEAYAPGGLAFAANEHDKGKPGKRRPGLAVLSRHPFIEPPVAIQNIEDNPVEAEFPQLGDGLAGNYRLETLSRPILRARISVHGRPVTVFNCHLKSKLGEFRRGPEGFAAEQNLLDYDPVGRALGEVRALTRRAAEAVALRRMIVEELKRGVPVVALGDFNDSEHSVAASIIAGERPFRNYAWLRRHDAKRGNDRYSATEDARIQKAMGDLRLESAERMFVRKSEKDALYTSSFGGVYESIDQILLSRHFQAGHADQIAELDYCATFNDHLTDGLHPEAPYNKLASDHGEIVASLRFLNG